MIPSANPQHERQWKFVLFSWFWKVGKDGDMCGLVDQYINIYRAYPESPLDGFDHRVGVNHALQLHSLPLLDLTLALITEHAQSEAR